MSRKAVTLEDREMALQELSRQGVKVPDGGMEFRWHTTRFRDGYEVTELVVSWPGQVYRLTKSDDDPEGA